MIRDETTDLPAMICNGLVLNSFAFGILHVERNAPSLAQNGSSLIVRRDAELKLLNVF